MKGFDQQRFEYLAKYQKKVPSIMDEIKQEGIRDKVPIVGDDIGILLNLICSIHKPSLILEIGCGISYSTHWMLLGNPKSKIVAIDSNKQRIARCDYFLNRSGLRERVELIDGWAEDYFKTNQNAFDMIFQDSTKKEYVAMIEPCYDRLNVGGLLVADNILFNGKVIEMTPDQEKKYANGVTALKRFTTMIAQHPGFDCTFLDYGDGALIAKRIK